MYNRTSCKLSGPVRSVKVTFYELENDGDRTIEVRPQQAGFQNFDTEGRLREESSPDRILMDDVFRDVYIYSSEGRLIEREEYDSKDKPLGKTVFGTDADGNRIEDHYYFSIDGQQPLLSSRTTHRADRSEIVNFNSDGSARGPVNASAFGTSSTELSESETHDGYVLEERRYNDNRKLTLRIVTRYDRQGNEMEYSTYDHELDGEMYIKQEYEYEFDEFGNWITQTIFRWVVGWGPFRLVPYTRTRRVIDYYLQTPD